MDEPNPQEPEIMTAAEAAEWLQVPLNTIHTEARAGRLPGRKVGKEWRFSRSVLREWLHGDPEAEQQRYRRPRTRTTPDAEGGS
jgi:excisionase family DNA binding protein